MPLMPRAPRIELAGAIYHGMNRGNHLEAIFRDDKDREVFLKNSGGDLFFLGLEGSQFRVDGQPLSPSH